MNTLHHTVRVVVLSGLALLVAAAAPAPEPAVGLDEISVLPRENQWSLVPPKARPALQQAVQMSPAQRTALVQAEDGRRRGIGLFVAEQQGDIAFLLSVSHLLDDRTPTVPYARPVAHVGGYARADQTVAEYLSSIYMEWFGVDADKSRKRFDKLIGRVAEPKCLVRPWIVRLRRAGADKSEIAALKTQIAALPEDVRWAVVTLGYKNSLYTHNEAQAALHALSADTRDAIQTRRDLLPDEPLFRVNDGLFRKTLLTECRRLLNERSS